MPRNRNPNRSPGKRYHDRMMRVAWACYLGANTMRRLATELGVPRSSAHSALETGVRRGYLTRRMLKTGVGRHAKYAPVRELVQEYFVS